ncbi:MAG: 23S rRNA (guanosine(2251)-2'-O)-methyltransferase RlmB [Myxococcales bacterium]|nr:23S rRNA (guanosine(2251)-2'-O)-methyltransferase RlmB [Myxococcales bacterium]MCH7869995.1 23S rRNA (guanosine(2251)-2'-O)-methyltransferase RlmB [Myxococcales bacterium]
MKKSAYPRRPASNRQSSSTEVLFGVHSCVEALRAGRRRSLALLVKPGAERRPEIRDLIEAAREQGLPIRNLDPDLSDWSEIGNPQGVGLEVGPLPELTIEELVVPSDSPRRLVILDGVEDPQNVGALARVAEGSGVKGMVLSKRRAPPLSPALVRASAGAIEWLPVARVTNLARSIKYLKTQGFWVVGADPSAAESLYTVPDRVLQGDLAVVLGAEGKGLRPEVQKLVDHPVRIDMQGQVASLNVAAAGAVLLFELLRRAGPARETS